MKGKLKRIRIEVAGSAAMENRTIDPSYDSKGAARVAMPFGPMRTDFQQALVRRRSLFVSTAITEYPRA